MTSSKIAIVTGGGSGIGKAVALALHGAGWKVALAGRRQAPLDEVCAEAGEGMLAIAADVADEAAVASLFDQTIAAFGRVDLLFNNAGIGIVGTPVGEVSLEDWNALTSVNVTGAFLCAREAFRRMQTQSPRGGRIINNGSVAAHAPRPNSVAYTVSKHAMTGLTRALSLEGRALDIAVGQIDVGNAATEIGRQFSTAAVQADGSLAPEPMMDSADVGASVLHMASLPLEANVLFMTVIATKMPFVGRG